MKPACVSREVVTAICIALATKDWVVQGVVSPYSGCLFILFNAGQLS